jgi:xylan 1,4-beta-xylosidase
MDGPLIPSVAMNDKLSRVQANGLSMTAGLPRPSKNAGAARIWALALILLASPALAQQEAAIRIDASGPREPFATVWDYFGYDEPNYTYAPNGKKLLAELSELSSTAVQIRMHNLLSSGDGTAALKWGSTNAYSQDAMGRSVHDWTIVDRIFDTLMQVKAKPLVEIGFMPQALSVRPNPYRHQWPEGTLWTGWAYPPRDYQPWAELVYQWVRHAVERYGKQQVQSWKWEVWNEPDIGYWQGSPDEYYKLYDYAADAVKRALPEARVGGPDSTGPVDPHAAEFLRRFLAHCAGGSNYATGEKGVPLDFVAFHAKGDAKLVEGHVVMGISRQLQSIDEGFRIVRSFPQFKDLPVILGESDPEGCAACSARRFPQNVYRNGPLYACYTAEMLARTLELAAKHQVSLAGVVTWAFEFENQPYFEGFRTLATNGIDKPVLNVFRMFGMLGSGRIALKSSSSLKIDSELRSGVPGQADISGIATLEKRGLSVIVWNYHDQDVAVPAANVQMIVTGLPPAASLPTVRHYRIDQTHSNAYTAWKEMGSPQQPTPEQYRRLLQQGGLQELSPRETKSVNNGELRTDFPLPRHAVSLIQISW